MFCVFKVENVYFMYLKYAWLIFFVLFVETRFHHVAQADLELLSSSDLPVLASQSAGTAGVSHHT